MPTSLEDYLHLHLPSRTAELSEIRSVARSVLTTFHNAFDAKKRAWPYRVDDEQAPIVTKYSYSTNAMVLFAMRALCGTFAGREGLSFSSGKPGLLTPLLAKPDRDLLAGADGDALDRSDSDKAWNQVQAALTPCLDASERTLLKAIKARTVKSGQMTTSGTFGDDDPFTICWILEALDEWPTVPKNVMRTLVTRVTKPAAFAIGKSDNAASPHALPLARSVQLLLRARQLGRAPKCDLTAAHQWFQSRIHEHLSYASIPDSSFDAPELIFSLEGLLLCEPELAGMTRLIERIFSVLTEKQEHNPNLRPYRPILADERGSALLPLTIEVFTALLRILERLYSMKMLSEGAVSGRQILTRYTQWLLGQCVTIATGRKSLSGWSSEHTNSQKCVHVWETSQVIAFLSHYHTWIRSNIQNDLLATGAFTVSQPTPKSYYPTTERGCAKAEPNSTISLYRALWSEYVNPRLVGVGKKKSSLLLYGPPGTGKTSFAEFIASTLGWPLVTLTPSDFIVRGDQLVEERAKALFRALEQFSNVVVLLDELDRLLIDRDSQAYLSQNDLFQFMTPSMLPKLRRLRQRDRVIFVLATNYEERIDPAAKRTGRIDFAVLVSPPDRSARERFFREHISAALPAPLFRAASRATALLTYAELQDVLDIAQRSTNTPERALRKVAKIGVTYKREISLDAYASRFRIPPNGTSLYPNSPSVEFKALYAIAKEAPLPLSVVAQQIATLVGL